MDAAAALSLSRLQVVPPCSNVRGAGSFLAAPDDSTCLAPGLFHAATAMKSATKVARASCALDMTTFDTNPAELPGKPFVMRMWCVGHMRRQLRSASRYQGSQIVLMCNLQAAAELGRRWTGDALAAHVRGGLGCFRLAQAEAAAQAALATRSPEAVQPGPQVLHKAWRCGADTLAAVARNLMPAAALSLTKQGLVAPLLQVGSRTPAELMHLAASWSAWLMAVMPC
jgi:hypothetical protein